MSINFDSNANSIHNELNGHAVAPLSAQPIIAPGKGGSTPAPQPQSEPEQPAQKESAAARLLRRLEAQKRSRVAKQETPAHESDPLARNRDKDGNPIGRVRIGLLPSLPSEKRVESTRLQNVLEELALAFPVRANKLWHEYNEVVQEQLRRYQEMARQAWADLNAHNAEIIRRNVALEARRAELEVERDAATEKDRTAILELDAPLAQAHNDASKAVSLAGGAYSPAAPSEECVLRHQPKPLRVLAGLHGITFPEEGVLKLWKTASEIATVLAGVLLGTSFGIAVGIVDYEAATFGDGGAILLWLLFAAFGWGFAVKIRSKLWKLYYDAGERQALALPGKSWMPALGTALAVSLGVVLILCFIEQFGLLKLSALIVGTGGGGHIVSAAGALAMGATSVFFVGATAVDGWIEGRHSGTLSRLTALQAQEFEAQDAEIRARIEVQTALQKIAVVQDLLRQKGMLEARVEQIAQPFNAERDELEAQKEELRESLAVPVVLKLQDEFNQWYFANAAWESKLEELIAQVESLDKGVWDRLQRAVRGPQRPKSRRRDDKQRE